MKFNSDIDIDTGDRDKILSLIKHTPAAMRDVHPIRKHATGIYVTEVPYDPLNDMASIDYKTAENRGYFKLDLLNVHIYNEVKDETHLIELMREPNWNRLKDKDFFEKLIHISNHYDTMLSMPEDINTIPRLSMFLAIIRPGKKHLVGKSWKEVSESVWTKETDGYQFKKAHAVGYSWLVAVHMNLLEESMLFV